MKNRPDMPSEAAAEIGEDELILHYYGESVDPRSIEKALAESADLRRRYAELARDLATATTAPPEPPADLGARVWRELRPRLVAPRPWWRALLAPATGDAGWGPRWTLAAASLVVVAALALGYFAGRWDAPRPDLESLVPAPSGLSTQARERLLLASVESHLAGSERLLTRVTNAAPTDATALAEESAWAGALVSANRLYRSAAGRAGQRRIVALLDELEPLLLELANSAAAAPEDLAAAQRRIEHTDLLFKLRVTGERLQRDAGAPRAGSRTDTRTVS